MRNTLISIFLFGIFLNVNAQNDVKNPPSKENFESFLSEEVSKVVLISFGEKRVSYVDIHGVEHITNKPSPIFKEGLIDSMRIDNRVILQKNHYSKLIRILYDTSSKYGRRAMCYKPHNGMLFYNSNQKLIGFLEICFDCSRVRTYLKMPEVDVFTTKQFDELTLLFSEQKMKTSFKD